MKKLLYLTILSLMVNGVNAKDLVLKGDAAAQEHKMSQQSSTLKKKCLNGKWDFYPLKIYANKEFPHTLEFFRKIRDDLPKVPEDAKWEKILVPSMWNYYWGMASVADDGKTYSQKWGNDVNRAWYRRSFEVPKDWPKDRRIILKFDGATGLTRVFLNGQKVGSHFGSLFPFEFDITDHVKRDGQNELRVFSVERFSARKGGIALEIPDSRQNQFGIYRDVWLTSVPDVIPENIQVITSVRKKKIEVNLELKNLAAEKRDVDLKLDIVEKNGTLVKELEKKRLEIPPGKTVKVSSSKAWENPKLWDVGQPNLYFLRIRTNENGKLLSEKFERFGFREFWYEGPFFYLNGKKISFRGDWSKFEWNGCPAIMYPAYMRMFVEQMQKLNFQGPRVNTTSNPEWLIDLFDEVGMPIIATGVTPNYFGDPHPECLPKVLNQVRTWIRRDRNHPSILLWSTMNEATAHSKHHPRYKWQKQVVDLIAKEDPTRPQYHDGHCSYSKIEDFFTTGNLAGDLDISSGHYGVLHPKAMNGYSGSLNLPKYWPKKRPVIIGEEGPFGILSLFYPALAVRTDGVKGLFYDVEQRRNLSGKWLKRLAHAWRAWEIPGFLGFESFRSSWENPFPVVRSNSHRQFHKRIHLDYADITTPGPKGQLVIGHYHDDQPRANPWSDKYPRMKKSSYAKWVIDAYSPVFATITRNWQSNYFTGETVVKKIDLVNDLRHDAKNMELSWGLFNGDEKLAGEQVTVNIAQGTVIQRELSFKVPELEKQKEFQLRVTLDDANKKRMSSETLIIHAYPKVDLSFLKNRKIMLFDPKGETAKALAKFGAQVEPFDIQNLIPNKTDLLLIGREGFKSLSKKQLSLVTDYIRKGGNVFTFRQAGKREVSACTASIAAPAHPIFKGLKPDIISNWRVKPDSVLFKHAQEWPESGRFRVLAQLGAELAGRHESVFTEYFEGKGRLIISGLELTDAIEEEPEAQILLKNILSHYSVPNPLEFVKTVYISATGKDTILKPPFSLDTEWFNANFATMNLQGVATVILGPLGDLTDGDKQIIREKINAFKGQVLVLPQKDYQFVNSLLGSENVVKVKTLKGGMGGKDKASELVGFYNINSSDLGQGLEPVFQHCATANAGLPLKILPRLFVAPKDWKPLLTAYQRFPGKARGEFGAKAIADQLLMEKVVSGKHFILSLLPVQNKVPVVDRIYLTLLTNLGVGGNTKDLCPLFDLREKGDGDVVVQANGLRFFLKGAAEFQSIELNPGKSFQVEKRKSAGIAIIRSGVRGTGAPYWRFLPGIKRQPGDIGKPVIKAEKNEDDILVSRQGLLRDQKTSVDLKYNTTASFLKNGKFSFDSKFDVAAGDNEFHRVFTLVRLEASDWWRGKKIAVLTKAGKKIEYQWPKSQKPKKQRIKNPRQISFSAPSGIEWCIDVESEFDWLEFYSDGKKGFNLIFEPKGGEIKKRPFQGDNGHLKWSPTLVQLRKGDSFNMKLGFTPKLPQKEQKELFSSLMNNSVLPMPKYDNNSKEGKRYFFVNIVKKCNAPFGGKKWSENLSSVFHLKKLLGGDYWLNGIPFHLIDADNDELEGGDAGLAMSMMVMRGEYRPDFPDKISGIIVGEKAKKLFFLQSGVYMSSASGAWDKKKELEMWKYRINYADGRSVDVPVIHHQHIKDWYRPKNADLPKAKIVYIEKINAVNYGVWAQTWVNPFPDKVVSTIDIISANKGIPIILGITGERYSDVKQNP